MFHQSDRHGIALTISDLFVFQVKLSCLLLECLTSARKWTEGLAACEQATKSIANKRLHRPLLTWKAVCLANLGAPTSSARASSTSSSNTPRLGLPQGTSGIGGAGEPVGTAGMMTRSSRDVVQGEMFKIKEYIPEYQGHTWAALSHYSPARYDQMTALQKGVQAVSRQPWVKTFYLAEYAEWLISTGMNDSETVEDVLLTAADAIMEFDMGEEGGAAEEADEAEAIDDESNPYAADAQRDRLKRKKKKRLNINAGEDTLDPNMAPSKLTATLLERFVRIFVMLSQVSTVLFCNYQVD